MATYRQRGKKKTWDYRIYDSNKKLIASGSGFKTKREAKYEAEKLEHQFKDGAVELGQSTLYGMWQEWYRLKIEPTDLSESSKNKHLGRGALIKRDLSYKKARLITHSEYQAYLNNYSTKVTRGQVSNLNNEIRKVLQFAKSSGIIIGDFTQDVVIVGPRERKKPDEKYITSLEDYERVLSYLVENMDYSKTVNAYYFYFMLKTGLRPGEGLAVCWQDIDFENGVVSTYRRYAGDRQGFFPPKTKTSIRTVPLDDSLMKVLKKLKVDQEELLKRNGILNEENFVFYNWKTGVPTNTALNKYLKTMLNSLEIDTKMTTTGTRHTYGSYLLAQGVDIWVVSRLLGHKDIQQIIGTYGHLLREKMEEGFNQVRQLLDK